MLRQLLLAQRPGAEQRHQRRGQGAVGHQGPAGRNAGLPAAGRQVPRGRATVTPMPAAPSSKEGRGRAPAMAQGYRHVRVQVGVPRPGRPRRAAGRPRRGPATALPPGGCTTARCSSAVPPAPHARCLRARAASSSATTSSCCTTSTSAYAPSQAIQFAKDWSSTSSSSWRTRSRPRTSTTSSRSAAVRHADRDGRAVQQPARMDAADHRSG